MHRSVAVALIDQGVLSLFNLGLNLALIKFAAPVEFGRFIYALTLILIMTSIQNALVQTPISVMLPGRTEADRRAGLATVASFDIGLRVACALAAGGLCLLTEWSPAYLAAVMAALFTTLARETARNIYVASERVRRCLALDTVAVVVSVASIAVLWTLFAPAVACLLGLAAGNGVALALVARGLVPERLRVLDIPAAYAKFWSKTKWSLVGAATTELQYRNYVFAIEFFRSTSTLASVQAGRLLLGPLALMAQSWARVARPAMAKALAQDDQLGAIRTFLTGLVLVVTLGVGYCATLWFAWPWLQDWIFGNKYPGIAQMTVAWTIYALINVTNIALSSLLLAANELRDLAMVSVGTALLTCILLLGLHFDLPSLYVVQVLVAGEAVALVWLIVLVMRLFAGTGPATVLFSMSADDGSRR